MKSLKKVLRKIFFKAELRLLFPLPHTEENYLFSAFFETDQETGEWRIMKEMQSDPASSVRAR